MNRRMRIGIDLDNTIICFDRIFFDRALGLGVVPPSIAPTKAAVRAHLHAHGRSDDWIELQSDVYADGIAAAEPFPGALSFLADAAGHYELFIVSHKTRYSERGPRRDLRSAARAWLASHGVTEHLPEHRVFFEDDRDTKARRIAWLRCDTFIDDLPDVFVNPHFPPYTQKLLFDPAQMHVAWPGVVIATSWESILASIARTRLESNEQVHHA